VIYKTPHKKLNIEQHEPHLKTGCEFRCTGRVNSSYSTCGTRLTNHTINDHGGEFVSQCANPLCEMIDIHLTLGTCSCIKPHVYISRQNCTSHNICYQLFSQFLCQIFTKWSAIYRFLRPKVYYVINNPSNRGCWWRSFTIDVPPSSLNFERT
jgi:hypothetical protein